MKVVECSYARGWNTTLLSAFGVGPKWTVECGECGAQFRERLPLMTLPRVICPHCQTINEIPLRLT